MILLVVALCSSSCNKDKRNELFVMTQEMEFEIRAGLNVVETHFFVQPATASTYKAFLELSGFDESVVATIEPKFADLTTAFGDVDLDFVRYIEIRVFDSFDVDYQREVFYLDPVLPNTRGTIYPFPGLSDVKGIVTEPAFGIEVRLIFRYPPPSTFNMRLSLDFAVFAD